jgi:hypothetical protein
MARTPAGVLLTSDAYPQGCLHVLQLTLREHNIAWELPVTAPIRGSSGSAVLGGASTGPHDVTELDAMLSTIADFASLALH